MRIFILFLSVCASALAQTAFDRGIISRNAGNAMITSYVAEPNSGELTMVLHRYITSTSYSFDRVVIGSGLKEVLGTTNYLNVDFTGLSIANVNLTIPYTDISGLSTQLAGKQPHSTVLDDIVSLAVDPDEALRTDGTGNIVADSPSDFLAWLDGFPNPTGTSSQYIRGDGTLATFPSVPAAQVNSDWNSVAGVSQILNKPVLGTAAAQNTSAFDAAGSASSAQAYAIQRANHTGTQLANTISDFSTAAIASVTWSTLTGKPSFSTVATSGAYSDLIGAPTNLSSFTNGPGYITGITSGMVTTALGYTPLSAEVDGSVTNEIELPTQTGQSGKVLSTNGTSPSWIAASTGTVTSVTAGTGLSGGTITTTGTISLPNTGTAGTYSGVTTDAQGRVTAGTNRAFNNTASKTLVTSPTAQGGTVIDASRDAAVTYSVSTSTTATIGGASSVTVYLEIATTNSATAGDWTAIQTVSNGQTITLAITLQSVQSNTLTVSGIVPAGYYMRVRYAVAGIASASYINGQEVKL